MDLSTIRSQRLNQLLRGTLRFFFVAAISIAPAAFGAGPRIGIFDSQAQREEAPVESLAPLTPMAEISAEALEQIRADAADKESKRLAELGERLERERVLIQLSLLLPEAEHFLARASSDALLQSDAIVRGKLKLLEEVWAETQRESVESHGRFENWSLGKLQNRERDFISYRTLIDQDRVKLEGAYKELRKRLEQLSRGSVPVLSGSKRDAVLDALTLSLAADYLYAPERSPVEVYSEVEVLGNEIRGDLQRLSPQAQADRLPAATLQKVRALLILILRLPKPLEETQRDRAVSKIFSEIAVGGSGLLAAFVALAHTGPHFAENAPAAAAVFAGIIAPISLQRLGVWNRLRRDQRRRDRLERASIPEHQLCQWLLAGTRPLLNPIESASAAPSPRALPLAVPRPSSGEIVLE